jgi:hypothetical protein
MSHFTVFLKRDCATCQAVAPVLADLHSRGVAMTVWVQDDWNFYASLGGQDDTALHESFLADVETVPTLLRDDGARAEGWDRAAWEALTGQAHLGPGLPPFQPGCGSRTREAFVHEALAARFGPARLAARAIPLGAWDDDAEACFDRGWSDGLPVVPPTDARILRMLAGTTRSADEIVGSIPPNLVPCTVEKVAINAVMAGCRPEYMPVLLAAIEAALAPVFTLHGVTCSTCFSAPMIVVNGPIARRIGMNSGANALGQGNRANSTIGRALNLIIRNVGGAVPASTIGGGIDQATLGGPHKVGFCFAEAEDDPSWQPLAQARGIAAGRSAVTLFQGEGIQGVIDWKSRTADELARSLALSLMAVGHWKLCEFFNAILVLSPEHHAIFRDAGWGRAEVEGALRDALRRPGRDLVAGAGGVGEGMAATRAHDMIDKFWPEGLLVVRAGGEAGLYSAICAGWTGGRFRAESQPVTREIGP